MFKSKVLCYDFLRKDEEALIEAAILHYAIGVRELRKHSSEVHAMDGATLTQTLISPQELALHLTDPEWVILDCRFNLADPQRSREDYRQAHIPGAVYVHLEEDLSGPIIPGLTGRHPLPTIEQAAERFSRWGIAEGVQVVAYDEAGGALAAARAWWMLRWLGHEAAAVLDGGWQRWLAEGYPLSAETPLRPPRRFRPRPRPELVVTADQVEALRNDPRYRLCDARSADRYHGKNETIDPVAGHIPGALSAPYMDNFSPTGVFKPVEELAAQYQRLLGDVPAERTVFYCGSGVTATLDILALLHAGLGEARLYPGSWSEWITDRNRPVAK